VELKDIRLCVNLVTILKQKTRILNENLCVRKKLCYNITKINRGKIVLRFTVFVSRAMIVMSVVIISILAESKINNNPLYTDPAFKSYLDLFQKDANKFKIPIDLYKLTTVFSTTVPVGVLGYCVPSTNTVVISQQSWDKMDIQSRKILLYHEWGHCTLKRDHTEDLKSPYSFCPVSMMYPYIAPTNNCYSELEGEYLEELFTNPYNYPKISRRD
jgi:hypothetical protein